MERVPPCILCVFEPLLGNPGNIPPDISSVEPGVGAHQRALGRAVAGRANVADHQLAAAAQAASARQAERVLCHGLADRDHGHALVGARVLAAHCLAPQVRLRLHIRARARRAPRRFGSDANL